MQTILDERDKSISSHSFSLKKVAERMGRDLSNTMGNKLKSFVIHNPKA